MNILALDTSSTACSVALCIDDQLVDQHTIAPLQQSKLILPTIKQLLEEKNISLKQLNAIAFGCGPGSFTGVRIAISVAQGLAFAADKPLISISSLAALAQAAYDDTGWKNLAVAIDARINEVYWGLYEVQVNGLVNLVGKEAVCAPSLIELPAKGCWSGVGNAWDVYANEILDKPAQISVDFLPTARALLSLAKAKFLAGDIVSADKAIPVYLRDEVAKKSAERGK